MPVSVFASVSVFVSVWDCFWVCEVCVCVGGLGRFLCLCLCVSELDPSVGLCLSRWHASLSVFTDVCVYLCGSVSESVAESLCLSVFSGTEKSALTRCNNLIQNLFDQVIDFLFTRGSNLQGGIHSNCLIEFNSSSSTKSATKKTTSCASELEFRSDFAQSSR